MGADQNTQDQDQDQPRDKQPTITHLQFLNWKKRKEEEARICKAEASRQREEDITSGRARMNGRELFHHEPWVFDNDQY